MVTHRFHRWHGFQRRAQGIDHARGGCVAHFVDAFCSSLSMICWAGFGQVYCGFAADKHFETVQILLINGYLNMLIDGD